MIHLLSLILFVALALRGEAAGIDVPLTVRETGGVDRHQWPLTTGVPLPMAALKSTEKLQLLDIQGRFIPARFAVASRWPEDGSIQWVHCDFAATVKANESITYFLRDIAPLPEFPSPIGLIPRGKAFEIVTGPLRLVLGGNSNQLLDQVWVDENWGYDFTEKTKILESGNFDLVLVSTGRSYRTSHWVQNQIEVEEYNALRAVIKVSGSFVLADRKEKLLDYVARLTVYGGKTYFKLDFTLLNRPVGQTSPEISVDELNLSIKMNLDLTQQRFGFGGDNLDYSGNFESVPRATFIQESADRYELSGVDKSSGSGSRSSGWADLSDGELGLSIAVKWFWQLYPKAFEVRNDGTVVVKLFPDKKSPPQLPAATTRTHEMLFHFHGKRQLASGQVKKALLGFQQPLYATAPPQWYCRNTQVFGRLTEATLESEKSEFSPLLSSLDPLLIKGRDALLAARDLPSRRDDDSVGSYGVFRFGNFFPHPKTHSKLNPRGDLAHSLYLHFFRTGDLTSLKFAEEVLAQAADFGTSAEGSSTTGQVAGIAIEGLFDSFLLTGNRRHLEAARSLASSLLKDRLPTSAENMAGVAGALLGVLRSYEVTGDRRWLSSSQPLLEVLYAWQDGDLEKLAKAAPGLAARWREEFRHSFGVDTWDCGMIWAALRRHREITGDKAELNRLERSWEWLRRSASEWDRDRMQLRLPRLGMVLAPGLAALAEKTGEEKYWNAARELFQIALESAQGVEEPNLFGLCFTEGQQFLGYLSNLHRSTKREVSVLKLPLQLGD